MQARNEPGASADLHSLTDVAQFDPTTKKWRALPELPGPVPRIAPVLDNSFTSLVVGRCVGAKMESGLKRDLFD